jgi:hypothetical protein
MQQRLVREAVAWSIMMDLQPAMVMSGLPAQVVALLVGALYPRKKLVHAAEAAQAAGSNWLADAQVFVRRLACLGLAVAIVAETISGKVCLWLPSLRR